MRRYWALPEFLQIAAYPAEGEYAWPREEVLGVIKWLTEHACAVIGVDVWLATEPGPTIPTPRLYGWEYASASSSQPWRILVLRANAKAAEYVEAFAWHPEDTRHLHETPYFNLTVIEEQDRPDS